MLSARDRIEELVESNHELIDNVNDQIWEFAEVALKEYRSCEFLKETLAQSGFSIKAGAEDVPTSFIAEWGEGKPCIGFLAEYDALEGLSQKKGATEKQAIEGRDAGHACGHNSIAASMVGAVVALKSLIEETGLHGMIRFYGCPAEETVQGKVFMSRDGLFDDCDVAFSDHPNDTSYVWARKSVALLSKKFTFHGKAAHAGIDPWNGRSALDAVELMNVAANYLREHIPPAWRLQYVITDGGRVPNTVPERAQVWYAMRAGDHDQIEELHSRLSQIAVNAAGMTGTTVEEEYVSGCYDFLPNMTLAEMILSCMREYGAPRWLDEDHSFAKELYKSMPKGNIKSTYENFSMTEKDESDGLVNTIYDGYYRNGSLGAATDVGDVSWQIPVGCFSFASTVVGAPGHSWYYTAAASSGIGHRGTQNASKILALAAYRILTEPALLKKAKQEHADNTKECKYVCPLDNGNR